MNYSHIGPIIVRKEMFLLDFSQYCEIATLTQQLLNHEFVLFFEQKWFDYFGLKSDNIDQCGQRGAEYETKLPPNINIEYPFAPL